MTQPEPQASPALEALLRDGTLAGSWTLDPARSEVLLRTRHTWGLLPLKGVFREATANGTVSAAGDVTGTFAVVAASIDTKNSRRDTHLRSADFFDVANTPYITFTVESVTPASGGVRVTGSLTVRDQTRPVSFEAKAATVDGEVWLDAEVPVNRADYGLMWNWLGIAGMNNTIAVHAVFTRQ